MEKLFTTKICFIVEKQTEKGQLPFFDATLRYHNLDEAQMLVLAAVGTGLVQQLTEMGQQKFAEKTAHRK